MESIKTFLAEWKPFAELPPGNVVRRSILRFLEADDVARRQDIFAKANEVYRLQRTYEELGVFRDSNNAKRETFARLFNLSTKEFAEAVRAKQPKEFLVLLQEAFEFGRAKAPPNQVAARQFLSHLWTMQIRGTGLKYSIYSNGVLFTSGGKTHDEMAKEFKEQGFGGGLPKGGGTILREGELAFAYDTYSKFVQSGDLKAFVAESIRRWIRASGGEEEKVKLAYHDNVAQL